MKLKDLFRRRKKTVNFNFKDTLQDEIDFRHLFKTIRDEMTVRIGEGYRNVMTNAQMSCAIQQMEGMELMLFGDKYPDKIYQVGTIYIGDQEMKVYCDPHLSWTDNRLTFTK